MATGNAKAKRARTENLVRAMNKGADGGHFRVTLTGSEIGGTQGQRATLRCLGLRRRGSESLVPNTPQTRGRIRVVAHLVRVEEVR